MNQEKLEELSRRRNANPHAEWNGVKEWIEHSLALTKPGGVVSLVLPDGEPFVVRKDKVE